MMKVTNAALLAFYIGLLLPLQVSSETTTRESVELLESKSKVLCERVKSKFGSQHVILKSYPANYTKYRIIHKIEGFDTFDSIYEFRVNEEIRIRSKKNLYYIVEVKLNENGSWLPKCLSTTKKNAEEFEEAFKKVISTLKK